MVGDRNPFVVRQQRIVGAEQAPDRGGVMDGGVEVGEVADVGGDAILHCGLGHQQCPQPLCQRRASLQRRGQGRAQRRRRPPVPAP